MNAETPTPAVILLVEDEDANRSLVRAVIAKAETRGIGAFELHEVASLAQARRALTTIRPRIIFVDVRLPDGSGLDLVSHIRAGSGQDGDRPWIVVLTAAVQDADRHRALEAGADSFLAKPFRVQRFIDILDRMTRGSSDPEPVKPAEALGSGDQ